VGLFTTTDSNFPTGWTRDSILFDTGVAEKDPTPFEYGGDWYCFVGLDNSHLGLYTASSLTGSWSEHPDSPVTNGNSPEIVHFESPGGRPFFGSSDIFLPVVGGNDLKMSIMRITTLTPSALEQRVLPVGAFIDAGDFGGGWTATGMHQMDVYKPNAGDNLSGAFAVVDGKDSNSDWSIGVLGVEGGGTTPISGTFALTDSQEQFIATGQTKVSGTLSVTDSGEALTVDGATKVSGTASITDGGESITARERVPARLATVDVRLEDIIIVHAQLTD